MATEYNATAPMVFSSGWLERIAGINDVNHAKSRWLVKQKNQRVQDRGR